jgi:hypothetical protein
MMLCRARFVSTFALGFALSGLLDTAALAAVIQYQTSPGDNIDGESVHALATFTSSTDTINVNLTNLQTDPISPKSIIYDVFFTVSTGQTTGTIASTTGIERTVNGDGTFSDSGSVNVVDWGLFTSGAQLHLDRLAAGGQPAHGVIGPPNSGSGIYDAAGGSITGNVPHNPFWGGSADFVLNVPGVTASSTITAVTFSFNTTAGSNIVAVPVPEPASIAILAAGGVLLMGRRRRTS